MGTAIFSFFKECFMFIFSYPVLILLILTDLYISRNNKKKFLITILLCSLHLLADYLSFWAERDPAYELIREIFSYAGYIIRPFIIYSFSCLVFPESKNRVLFGACFLNLIMYVTTPFTHLCVYYDNGHFQRGPLGYVIFIICGLALLYLTAHSIQMHYNRHIRRWILPPLSSFLIVYAVYIDFTDHGNTSPSALSKALILVIFLFYLFYHLHLAEQYEEKLLQNQQLQLMISQIKPHFFFNAITTIQALCRIDPQKAADTLGTFASYIRQNIATKTPNLIPFTKELEHVKAYVDIELLRFPNIEVQYDLLETDFDIAALSIQPLVENAIKHGIRSREHGVVIVSTQKQNNTITIIIKDNGIGFAPEILETLDATHVGLNNVRNRLQLLQNAHMNVNSGTEGTTITITIPWEN